MVSLRPTPVHWPATGETASTPQAGLAPQGLFHCSIHQSILYSPSSRLKSDSVKNVALTNLRWVLGKHDASVLGRTLKIRRNLKGKRVGSR